MCQYIQMTTGDGLGEPGVREHCPSHWINCFASSVMAVSLSCLGFAIDDCELDWSNSQQGYSWMKNFVSLEATNRKMA